MKKSIENVIFIVSIVLTIGISLIFLTPMYIFALATFYMPTIYNVAMVLSSLVLLGFVTYIVDKYLLNMIGLFQKKKKIKAICMILVIILLIVIGILLKLEANTFLVTVLMPFLYVVGTIVIPIIIIGMMLLGENINKKRKVIGTIVLICITIGIYSIHYSYITSATEEVIKNVQNFWENKTEKISNSSEYNLVYLENYKQKMESEGYLDKYDIENILKIVDSRIDNIIVHYNNGEEELEYNNVDNQLTEKLGPKLEGDFYKFQYTHKNEQTDIYIEKYESEIHESEEKNADIFLTTEPNYNVTNTKADYETENDVNYLIENRVNLEKGTETTIDDLKIVFAYDSERHNYIPYVSDEQLRMIESYKIYSTGMSITLKEGVVLTKKDYTLRINRYNEYLVVDEDKEPFYSYKFEPIVSETRNGNGNTVMEINFGNTYALGDLKNIEIIF